MNNDTVLSVESVSKTYGDLQVLKDISIHAKSNEFVSIVGPSGCGKSTLFNIINGLTEADAGTVEVAGAARRDGRPKELGYVLQKDLLMPWRTVIDNVIVGLQVAGTSKKESREIAMPLLDRYKLLDYAQHFPAEISGGMRQRVALMRTMITDPTVILMDEAYKALDYPLKISLESELLEMVKTTKKTVLFVTHDIEEALTLSDRIYVLAARPGRVVRELNVDLEVDNYLMHERRVSPKLNEYYETVWRTIENPEEALV